MKVVLVAVALAVASGAAEAAVPAFAATCGKTEVMAAAGGPIMIKGKEAKLTVEKDNYYEASLGKLTVMLTVGADGKPSLAFVRKLKDKEKKGTCTIKA